MTRKIYASARLLLHILAGVVLLALTGAIWNNKTQLVKSTKQWWLARTVHLLGINVNIHGQMPIPTNSKGILYVSNHVSWIDIPLIGGLSQLNFLSKAEVRSWPLIGKLAEGTGTLFIKRGSGDAARVSESIARYLDEGRSVLFFPEGTTSDGKTVRKFHSKLFKAAHHTTVNVCPIAIHYHLDQSEIPSSGNPIAFIDEDEFTQHLWRVLGLPKVSATVEFLPVRSAPSGNLEVFVRGLRSEINEALQQLQRKTSTNIQLPDASTHDGQRDGATSFYS